MSKSAFGVRPDNDTTDALDMLERTWKKRFENIRAQMMYQCALETKKSIITKLRGSKEDKAYREGIDVAKVTGSKKGEASYAVALLGKKNARTVDPSKTIVIVRKKRRLNRSAPEVAVLVKFNPWTLESLPFTPSNQDATLTYRKASAREVDAVTKLRNKDQRVWKRQLTKAGLRPGQNPDDKNDRKAVGKAKGVSDLSLAGTRMEWGQGGTKPKPHWRPAIRDLKQNGIRRMMKKRDFVRAAIDPGFKGWMRWPTKTRKQISANVARTFKAFQQKLKR